MSTIQVRRGTAASATSNNPTLAQGEIGFETDTGKFKVGDGATPWNSLLYANTRPVAKQAMLRLTNTSSSVLSNAEIAWRQSIVFPQAPTAVRLRIRNYNTLGNSAFLFGANFTATYFGQQSFSAAGADTAAFVSAPSILFPSFTLPSDGSEYISAWVTNPGFLVGIPYLLSFAYSGGGTSQAQSPGTKMWFVSGAGSSAHVSDTGGASFAAFQNGIFDIGIEYQFAAATNLVGLVVGDSTSSTAGTAVTAANAVNPRQRWPERYSQRTGHALVNGAVASSTMTGNWNLSTNWIYQRLNPSGIAYDFAIIDVGINDVSAAQSLATFQTNFATVVAQLQALGITRIFATTMGPNSPNSNFGYSRLAAGAAAGATSISTDDTIANPTPIQIGEGYWNADAVTTNGAPVGSAPGPFTIPVPAITNAHRVGEAVVWGYEIVRLAANDWLRSCPCGIEACFNKDRAIVAPYNRSLWLPSLSNEGLHPSIAGHAAIETSVPNITKLV